MKVTWHDGKREPRNPADPRYPNGMDIDIAAPLGLDVPPPKVCKVDLPYPARRCGYYQVDCEHCGQNALVTTAGRSDDPRSLTLPCKERV